MPPAPESPIEGLALKDLEGGTIALSKSVWRKFIKKRLDEVDHGRNP
jgi:hypothetical protein